MARKIQFKNELQNYLPPYKEIYNNLGRTRKQSKITDFLKISAGKQNTNSSSKSVDDIMKS